MPIAFGDVIARTVASTEKGSWTAAAQAVMRRKGLPALTAARVALPSRGEGG